MSFIMQMKKALGIIAGVVLIVNFSSCRKEKSEIPAVKTVAITDITYTTAVSGGNVVNDGGEEIMERGVCWSKSPGPTVVDSRSADAGASGSFVSSLTGLVPDTKYYVRAYASNNVGIGYGQELSFTTSQTAVPDLTTREIISIGQKSAVSGGIIVSENGSPIVARGICWSKDHNPAISDSKSTAISDAVTYANLISSLDASTTYYVRAWATNRVGTGYGNEVSFTTIDYGSVSDTDGNTYRTVIIGSQVWMADNLKTTKYNNGEPIANITNDEDWGLQVGGAYCWYDNDEITNRDLYGALYNWYSLSDERGLCPTGWHIPGDSDWNVLIDYLSTSGYGYEGDGHDIAKSLASAAGWTTNDIEGTIGNNLTSNNGSGFEAVPGGVRIKSGPFAVAGYTCTLWSASALSFDYGNAITLSGEFTSVFWGYTFKEAGASVRCVMDN